MTQARPSPRGAVFLLLLIAFFSVFMYTFLHEGGHALVGLLFGGQLNAFNVNIFNLSAPHVNLSGDFTRFQSAVLNIAGVSLPFLVWVVFILAAPKKANPAIERLKVLSTLMVLSVFLVWIIFPFLYLSGAAPSDDLTHFLNNSGAPPLLVAGLSLLIYIGGWALFLSRIDGVRNELALFRATGEGWNAPGVRRTLRGMTGIFALSILLAFAANGFQLTTPPRAKSGLPLEGYQLVKTFSLSARAYTEEPILSFSLEQPRTVGVFLELKNIDTQYFDARLAGPGAFEKPLIHGEGYVATTDSSYIEEQLPPGEYRLLLTSHKSPGVLSAYTKGLSEQ